MGNFVKKNLKKKFFSFVLFKKNTLRLLSMIYFFYSA